MCWRRPCIRTAGLVYDITHVGELTCLCDVTHPHAHTHAHTHEHTHTHTHTFGISRWSCTLRPPTLRRTTSGTQLPPMCSRACPWCGPVLPGRGYWPGCDMSAARPRWVTIRPSRCVCLYVGGLRTGKVGRRTRSEDFVTTVCLCVPSGVLCVSLCCGVRLWGVISDCGSFHCTSAVDWLLQTAMPSLYKSVDCFVLPSRGEGWGRPQTEAMAMGLPVIGECPHADIPRCWDCYCRPSTANSRMTRYPMPHNWRKRV